MYLFIIKNKKIKLLTNQTFTTKQIVKKNIVFYDISKVLEVWSIYIGLLILEV